MGANAVFNAYTQHYAAHGPSRRNPFNALGLKLNESTGIHNLRLGNRIAVQAIAPTSAANNAVGKTLRNDLFKRKQNLKPYIALAKERYYADPNGVANDDPRVLAIAKAMAVKEARELRSRPTVRAVHLSRPYHLPNGQSVIRLHCYSDVNDPRNDLLNPDILKLARVNRIGGLTFGRAHLCHQLANAGLIVLDDEEDRPIAPVERCLRFKKEKSYKYMNEYGFKRTFFGPYYASAVPPGEDPDLLWVEMDDVDDPMKYTVNVWDGEDRPYEGNRHGGGGTRKRSRTHGGTRKHRFGG